MLTKLFDLVPGVVWAIVCAVLLLVSGTSYVRMRNAQSDLVSFRAEVATATAQAQADARAYEQALQQQVQRIANDAARKQTELASRVAAATAAAGQLRDDIDRLNARPAPEDPRAAAFAREASVARELLGTCSTQYRGVAQAADELRDQVTGLQNYATTICKAP